MACWRWDSRYSPCVRICGPWRVSGATISRWGGALLERRSFRAEAIPDREVECIGVGLIEQVLDLGGQFQSRADSERSPNGGGPPGSPIPPGGAVGFAEAFPSGGSPD